MCSDRPEDQNVVFSATFADPWRCDGRRCRAPPLLPGRPRSPLRRHAVSPSQMMAGFWCSVLVGLLAGVCLVQADTPANCTFQDVVGRWTLYEGERNAQPRTDCKAQHAEGPWKRKTRVTLISPNKVIDQYGNEGTWTMVYNQGFYVQVNGRSYFGYSSYKQVGKRVISYCHRTDPGLSHDVTLRHWSCFYAQKMDGEVVKRSEYNPHHRTALSQSSTRPESHRQIVEEVNAQAKSWRAEVHEPFLRLSGEDLLLVRGGPMSWLGSRPRTAPVTEGQLIAASQLPESFDWRDVNGQNFLSPVRNQGSCGSCYAFSSAGMMEARLRVHSNNTLRPVLSPQDVVSCSALSQGCMGGFPFLIAGRYGQDYGMVDETCAPYTGKDSACPRERCDRYYTASYRYVGGYYGGCNEALMRLALVRNGPLSVSFEVHDDFMHYKSGVYHRVHLDKKRSDEPEFEEVNHAVLLIGYGVDSASGEKYWIVKNSWGDKWGENGFFRIRRGTDEVGIESIAVEADPIPW